MSTPTKFGFVVEYVRDINTARKFYEEVMGLVAERDHPTFVQFESFAIASDEPMIGSGEPEVFWLIDDAEAHFNEMSKKANVCVPLQDVPFGKVFGIMNADGKPRYLLEFAKNRPSRQT